MPKRAVTLLAVVVVLPLSIVAQFDLDARILDYKGSKFPCEGTVTPKLIIRNEGNMAMSGCVAEAWKTGVIVNTFDWQLAIPAVQGGSHQPVFPDVPDVEPGDELEFRTKTVNGIPDENADGNDEIVEPCCAFTPVKNFLGPIRFGYTSSALRLKKSP
ncbi:MAG: hypothetical protein ACO1NQ_10705 [Flavobacteriales bacterium]